MKTYTAKASRDDRFWYIEVPEIGHSTQARNVKEADAMVRDLISIVLEVPADSFAVDIDFQVPASAAPHMQEAARLREKAASANTRAAIESRAAAAALKREGMTLRDIGQLMGVSFQRAEQLVKEPTVGGRYSKAAT